MHLTNVSSYQSKITYSYDDPARLQSVPAAATRHDTAYSTSLTARGNVTSVSRFDVTDINNASKALTSYTNYYTTGTPVSTTDPAGHPNTIGYADSFSDSVNRNTFAYPTTLTDADGFSSTLQYNFDIGATTRTQSPAPAGQSQGAIQTMTYNNLGQMERVTTTNNNAYKRFWYGGDFVGSYGTVNNATDELYSMQTFDGFGRPLGAASNHPGSTGGYKAQINVYDLMGRIKKASNPAETTSGWVPAGDDGAGWLYTQQTYDWQGRPLVTTNPDNTTKEASYSGCGCAGRAVVSLTDEAGRRQKVYSDVMGRLLKVEVLNWNDSVYSTRANTYNARDQITSVKQYQGLDSSGVYQEIAKTYDGYGRLASLKDPIQPTATTYTYNVARGGSTPDGPFKQTYTYDVWENTTARSYRIWSGDSIVEQYKLELEAQWHRTVRTGEENGSLVFYEQSANNYFRLSLSEGRHLNDGITTGPGMPESRRETRRALDYFSREGRSLYLLAIFHTHPNFPHTGESSSGDPSYGDIQFQRDFGNALGIIRSGTGYSFYRNGRTFRPDDARANECAWSLNKQRG